MRLYNGSRFVRLVSILVETSTWRRLDIWAYNLTLWPSLYKDTVNKCVYESYYSTVTV